MVRDLQDLGFRLTVWVHPFFNADANSFYESAINSMLVRHYDSPAPAITPWWDGLMTGLLDVSNQSAAQWYLGKLRNLMNKYNISSFKFDASETSWMPHIYSMANMTKNHADAYPTKWVQLAAEPTRPFTKRFESVTELSVTLSAFDLWTKIQTGVTTTR
ncbi:hypothetical protein DPMN_119515 [Dreissena polymorpha]|uniref:Glycoside hydrolase family 31 TIM barrel domain-containing protein n=1 Tax=Dreissena polymorpha TaxID=45954 RepID=A0A9D4GIW4_DREPO|nr:hypothetical protein DPMN_119515 [Dreissena polymorpha]